VQIPYDRGRDDYYAVSYHKQGSDVKEAERIPFKTLGGRTVYGTMGIVPDSTVADTRISLSAARMIGTQVVFGLGTKLARECGYSSDDKFDIFLKEYAVTDSDLQRLIVEAPDSSKTEAREAIEKDTTYLKALLKAEIAQLVWNDRDKYYQVLTYHDNIVRTAMTLFPLAQITSERWRH
jgi:carboxyl-terminal processing protease